MNKTIVQIVFIVALILGVIAIFQYKPAPKPDPRAISDPARDSPPNCSAIYRKQLAQCAPYRCTRTMPGSPTLYREIKGQEPKGCHVVATEENRNYDCFFDNKAVAAILEELPKADTIEKKNKILHDIVAPRCTTASPR